ncbi:MAG: hypothetical protein ACOY94_06915 [Bacillota bacterium]
MSTSGSEFLQNLIRLLYATPEVSAAWVDGDLTRPGATAIERIDLYLAVAPGFPARIGPWLAAAGTVAYSGPDDEGWRLVTLDGVEWLIHLRPPARTDRLQPVFDRREAAESPTAESSETPGIDLTAMAGRFWSDLLRAARALGQGEVYTTHGHLELCRRALIDLYRLALAPGERGRGWEGAGAIAALEPVREWLVAPLDLRAQWRSAHRLAAAYESLMLPLCQRLGLAYPMAIRNLAFGRLDQVRPDRAREVAPPKERAEGAPVPAPAGPPQGRLRVAKGRIRRE